MASSRQVPDFDYVNRDSDGKYWRLSGCKKSLQEVKIRGYSSKLSYSINIKLL